MEKKILIFVVTFFIIIIVILLGIGIMKKNDSKDKTNYGNELVETFESDDELAGPKEYDGKYDIYLKNKTGKDVEKMVINTYSGENVLLSEDEIKDDKLEQDDLGIIPIKVSDEDNIRVEIIITIEGKDYVLDSADKTELIYDQSVISFDTDGDNLVILEDE